ncbi:MAG TPA: Holliday junction branch migration protein RuvA [Candidatus Saccharimonadales bacterium]|nr:Holliday junction branch migration protein RuvA [Candidatus Saccharimonadales bacterium]
MIALLNGVVAEKLNEVIVLEVNGVGYGVLVPNEDFSKMTVGQSAKIYIHEHIRENQHELYGFTDLNTKNLFEQLMEVNGVGPKMALNILGVGTADELRTAIAGGDTKFIQAASGVGKRVTERIVVDLKDKVGGLTTGAIDALFTGQSAAKKDEAVQALVALGYTLPDAVAALSTVDNTLATEERVKQVLKGST